ncbi:hypothetical protein TCELL_0919 [Thermogladius calderae 1633]|uniref:DUF2299 domain-containing protein n=1 Tax=Thermogladius calderae (strain DSM 22663 / VKM B-2946 / 1633) TaxID=1184251 RepID=I3TF05_THEC1|nr:hypothetical protein TCELL_0919 [Thermogladius calderae 1633]
MYGFLSKDSVEERVNEWLIQEGFIVRKLEAPPEARITWGLDVNTPPPFQVNFKVFKTLDKPDRLVVLIGVVVSPEHRKYLTSMRQEEVLRFMSRLTRILLTACVDCQLTIQPSILDPQTLTVALVLFDDEVRAQGKQVFLKTVMRVLNAYSIIVSLFNEAYPILPQQREQKHTQMYA